MDRAKATAEYLRENGGPPTCTCGQPMKVINNQGVFKCPECGKIRNVYNEETIRLLDCI